MLKLNLGCGASVLEDYINIDQDSIEVMRKRYPNVNFATDAHIYTYNIFDLPYDDESVDEVLAESFMEHLSFLEEKDFFYEVKRVLKSGGVFKFSVPDFEEVVTRWLEAPDDWQDFYRIDDEAIKETHWFGTHTYEQNNRWGYLTAMLFGSQNGEGQFHQNCFTIPKIKAIMKRLNFKEVKFSKYDWKGDRDPMIAVECIK